MNYIKKNLKAIQNTRNVQLDFFPKDWSLKFIWNAWVIYKMQCGAMYVVFLKTIVTSIQETKLQSN